MSKRSRRKGPGSRDERRATIKQKRRCDFIENVSALPPSRCVLEHGHGRNHLFDIPRIASRVTVLPRD